MRKVEGKLWSYLTLTPQHTGCHCFILKSYLFKQPMFQPCNLLFNSLASFIRVYLTELHILLPTMLQKSKRIKKKKLNTIPFMFYIYIICEPHAFPSRKNGLHVQSCFHAVPFVYVISLLGRALELCSLQSPTWLRGKKLGIEILLCLASQRCQCLGHLYLVIWPGLDFEWAICFLPGSVSFLLWLALWNQAVAAGLPLTREPPYPCVSTTLLLDNW